MKTPLFLRCKAIASVCLAVGCLTSGGVSTANANLIRNGNFEDVPGTGTGYQGQGLLPNDWVAVNESADTYSFDGSYGLSPNDYGHFDEITPAQDGNRWVAGWSAADEVFGQTLTSPLTPGQSYTLSGYLLQAISYDSPGGYDIYLSADSSYDNVMDWVKIGRLGPTTDTTGQHVWEASSFSFLAPADAGSHGFLAFVPSGTDGAAVYPGLDNVDLSPTVVPEPTTVIAGALLLLPFGASTVRYFRKKRTA